MDYSKMSDFEINCLVAEATGHKPFSDDEGYAGLQRAGDITAAIVKGPRYIGGFSPCISPEHAWPLIQENLISINHYNGVWEASFEWDAPVGAFGTDETVTTSTEHKNPLRAAMVAYLMMREVSDVQGNPA